MKNDNNSLISTLIIPLWARAAEQAQAKPIILDPKSLEIYQKLHYEPSALKGAAMSQVGCCLRGRWIDQYTQGFVARHPECQVIQLGCGLDPRFERLAPLPKTAMWYDLDLPEAIALRREYLDKSSQCETIAASLFEEEWMQRLAQKRIPTLIVVEGVLMYFTEQQNRDFFLTLLKHFSTAHTEVVFDVCPVGIVNRAKYHDTVQKVGDKKAEFLWGPKNPKTQIEGWSPRLKVIRLEYMSDMDTQKRFPLLIRLCWRTSYGYTHFNQRLLAVALAPSAKGET